MNIPVTMPVWDTSCVDWERRIVNKEPLICFKPLFHDEVELALRVFKELTIADVHGKPKIGEVTEQWVYDFVSAIFGAYDATQNRRLISEFFLLISKKNTKSTIASGIMLTALILNDRDSAEFLIIAPTKEIANNSFVPARDYIANDTRLKRLFRVSEHTRTITHLKTKATLSVIAAESDAVGGKKGAFVLVDELWIFGKRANAESMLAEATGGLASFPEGFIIYLSTQSDEPPAGIFKKKLDYARDVRDGKIKDPAFLPVIYEFPKEMLENKGYLNPEYFYITNPNLGRSVDADWLERNLTKAMQDEESLRIFLAKHLNVEIGLALRSNRWAGADFWLVQTKNAITVDFIVEHCDVITVGIDGGGLDDLFGLAVLGRDKHDRSTWYAWHRAWVHQIALERRKEIAPILRDFERAGDLVIVESVGDDITQASNIVKHIYDCGKLPEENAVGLDKLGMPSLQDGLLDAGIPFECLVGVPQGYQLSGYAQTTERKLAEMKLWHAHQPMMAWVVGNAKGVMKGNALMITKQESGKAKIDPLIALFNAVALMSLNPEPAQKKYEIFFA